MGKRIYELSIDELKKKSRNFRVIFLGYVIAAIGIGFINSYFSLQSLNNLNSITDFDLYIHLLITILICIVFLLIFFLWFISESSYYKMLQLNADMLIYLKNKLGE